MPNVARDALPAAAHRGLTPPAVIIGVLTCVWLALPAQAPAQQPFVVDDAEVTPRRAWHLEISNQIDVLRLSARPVRWQNGLEVETAWGAAERLEVSALAPLIALATRSLTAQRVDAGLGDLSVAAKLRLTADPKARHAVAGAVSLELPSGDRDRQLGSGLVDYGLNVITQHRFDDRLIAHLNGGLVLAGNTQTGAAGIKERGTVITGGASLVRQFGTFGLLGGEVTFAWSEKATLAGSLVGVQVGGNARLGDGWTFDFGVGTGWFDASPRLSAQVGLSIDWRRETNLQR